MNRFLTAACAVAVLAIPGAALAQHHSSGGSGGAHPHAGGPHSGGHFSGRGGPGGFHSNFRGGGIHFAAGSVSHFSAHDFGVWRGGHWRHGDFGGRFGWWWWAGGFWYFYDTPIYPYPEYVGTVYVAEPQAVGNWYYCEDPAGYYPYVQRCRSPWRQVAPTPPAGPGGPQAGYSDGAPPPGDATEAPQDAQAPGNGPGDGYQQPQQDRQNMNQDQDQNQDQGPGQNDQNDNQNDQGPQQQAPQDQPQ
jgi:hypothetical protein